MTYEQDKGKGAFDPTRKMHSLQEGDGGLLNPIMGKLIKSKSADEQEVKQKTQENVLKIFRNREKKPTLLGSGKPHIP